MKRLANWIGDVVTAPDDAVQLERIRSEIRELCESFPAPGLPTSSR